MRRWWRRPDPVPWERGVMHVSTGEWHRTFLAHAAFATPPPPPLDDRDYVRVVVSGP